MSLPLWCLCPAVALNLFVSYLHHLPANNSTHPLDVNDIEKQKQ